MSLIGHSFINISLEVVVATDRMLAVSRDVEEHVMR